MQSPSVFVGVRLSAAGHLVELAVGCLNELDKRAGIQSHGCGENKVSTVGNGRGVGGSGSVDCVNHSGYCVGQVGDCGRLGVGRCDEHGRALNAGSCFIGGELVGIGGSSCAAYLDELAVGAFHHAENVAFLRCPCLGQQLEFTGLLDCHAVFTVRATFEGDNLADLGVGDVGNLESGRVCDGDDRRVAERVGIFILVAFDVVGFGEVVVVAPDELTRTVHVGAVDVLVTYGSGLN